jgi:hypothetical protein
MSFMEQMKVQTNLLALIESIDEEAKKGFVDTTNKIKNTDDAFDTVDFDSIDAMDTSTEGREDEDEGIDGGDEIEATLSDVEKSIVRRHLSEILQEITADHISEPALEMIIQEVVGSTNYLSEVEEEELDSHMVAPYLEKKGEVIGAYIKELLDYASENEGELPEDDEEGEVEDTEDAVDSELEDDNSEEDGSESEESKDDESEDEDEEEELEINKNPLSESDDNDEDDEKPIDEGICYECGEGLEVSENDVVRVVDDEDVQVLDDDYNDMDIETEDEEDFDLEQEPIVDEIEEIEDSTAGLSSRVDNMEKMLKAIASAVGANSVLSESIFDKKVVASKPRAFTPKGVQKSTTPTKSVAELRASLSGSPSKAKTSNQNVNENDAEVRKSIPTPKSDLVRGKGFSGKQLSQSFDNSGKPNTAQKNPGKASEKANLVAATLNESKTTKKSFLEEARRAIRGI